MKFKIKTETLKEALHYISAVTVHRTMLPILGNVKIEAKDSGLILSVTNLDLFLTHKIQAEVEVFGAITTPLSLLSRLVNVMQSSEIEITQNGTGMDFVCGETKALFEGLPAEEFPSDFVQKEKGATFDAKDILEPFGKLAHAIGTDPSQYVRMGIGITVNQKGCDFAATNGSRLAIFHGERISDEDVIVPDHFVKALLKLEPKDKVQISISDRVITVENDVTKLRGTLIQGTFPNWKQVVPKDGDKVFSGNRIELMSALRTCSLFSNGDIPALTMKGHGKQIEISNPGKSRTMVLGAELGGQPKLEIRFNSKFMLDTFSVMENDVARIKCSDENSPMLIEEGVFQSVINVLRHP